MNFYVKGGTATNSSCKETKENNYYFYFNSDF